MKFSTYCHYLPQIFYLIPIVVTFHYCKTLLMNKMIDFHYYNPQTNLDIVDVTENQCKHLIYEMVLLRKEILDIKDELQEIRRWKSDLLDNIDSKIEKTLDTFYSDQIAMFDYASEYSGGSIISTPETTPYPSKYLLRIFGAIDWIMDSQPNNILQPSTFPDKCYAFYGGKGRIQIKLGRPVIITHVSLEHMRIGDKDNINSAPKNFQVLGLTKKVVENLGNFVYDLDDRIIQTFEVIPKNQTFESVELRIFNNYGNEEFTCIYRFRVHSLIN